MSISKFRCQLSQMSENRLPWKVFEGQNFRNTWPIKMGKQYGTLCLCRLNAVNDVLNSQKSNKI